MSLITASQLAKAYGADDIFSGLTVGLPHGARVALVGPNGTGKTTLLRILAGLEEPSRGEVFRAKGLRLGYLPQEAALYSEGTLWEEMLTAFTDLRAREAELARLEAAMADPAQFDAIMEKYGPLQHQFELDGGYEYENKIKQVLTGLNFEPGDFQKPVEILSGGQKTRALLGRLLLESPDLLILDEPTNHLDIHAVEWLETWINDWHGAVLIVSHDRYFLDQTVSVVWEMQFGSIEEYRGNYSAYLRQRADRHERRLAEYQAQQEFIAKEQDYIRRNIAGQNTKQAQGRRKRLERMLAGPQNRVSDSKGAQMGGGAEARAFKPLEQQTIKLRIDTDLRSGDRVIESKNLAVGYSDDKKILFRAPDLLLWREECAALVGPNGAGKTTFLKTLLGEIKPLAGSVKLGSSLKVGYFAQAHEGLNPENVVLDEVRRVVDLPIGKARDYLAKFLFTGDDVFKKVEVLSGGERGRLALAKLALEGANLLLLDEPTNHLDIPSQEILEAVLSDFPGTILLVSHDRYLIDALATQVWEVDEGELTVFKGSWSEYMAWKEEGGKPQIPSPQLPITNPQSPNSNASSKAQKAADRKRAARLSELENQIEALEQRKMELADELAAAGRDIARVKALGEEYAQVEADLAARMEAWATLAAQ